MFDFSQLTQIKQIKNDIDKKDPNKVSENNIEVIPTEVVDSKTKDVIEMTQEVVTDTNTINSKVTMDEKLDMWIEEYKDQPKVVYSDVHLLCTYDDKTETIIIVDKKLNESISFIDKMFFEYAVFSTNTRQEKEKFILEKYKEITGVKIGIPIEESSTQQQDEEVEEVQDMVIPDDILDF